MERVGGGGQAEAVSDTTVVTGVPLECERPVVSDAVMGPGGEGDWLLSRRRSSREEGCPGRGCQGGSTPQLLHGPPFQPRPPAQQHPMPSKSSLFRLWNVSGRVTCHLLARNATF